MILDVSLDDFCGHSATHRAREKSVFPKFASPQLATQLGILPKYRARTQTLQTLQTRHYLRDRQLGRERTKHMNMIHAHFQFFHFNAVGLGDLQQQFSHPLVHSTRQNLLAVFGRPYQVILRVVNIVRAAPKTCSSIVAATHPSGFAAALFPPAPQAAGYPERF